jgi:DNA (cytosine-5)-methyltransferase 1
MVGNAVSVPVAQWVAGRIKKPGAVLEFEQHEIVYGKKWPDAAWNVAGQRVGIRASDRPVAMATPSISVFRDKSWTRLSDRALNGFIERVVAGGLRVPLGFVDALRNAGRKVGKAA